MGNTQTSVFSPKIPFSFLRLIYFLWNLEGVRYCFYIFLFSSKFGKCEFHNNSQKFGSCIYEELNEITLFKV